MWQFLEPKHSEQGPDGGLGDGFSYSAMATGVAIMVSNSIGVNVRVLIAVVSGDRPAQPTRQNAGGPTRHLTGGFLRISAFFNAVMGDSLLLPADGRQMVCRDLVGAPTLTRLRGRVWPAQRNVCGVEHWKVSCAGQT